MKNLRDFFKRDRFVKHIGVELVEVRPGWARAKMEIKDFHLNGVDTVQGGALFTLADFAFAAACNSHGDMVVASNATISFCKTSRKGVLYAEAREVSRGRSLSTYYAEVTNEDGQVVAAFQGTGFRRDINNITVKNSAKG